MKNSLAISINSNRFVIVLKEKMVLHEKAVIIESYQSGKSYHDSIKPETAMRGSDFEIVMPIRKGIIIDIDKAILMCRRMVKLLYRDRVRWRKLNAVVSIPTNLRVAQVNTYREVFKASGFKDVKLVENVLSCAIGIGIDIEENFGNCIVVLDPERTSFGVIASSSIQQKGGLEYGEDKFNLALFKYIRRVYNLELPLREIESLFEIFNEPRKSELKGFNLVISGLHMESNQYVQVGIEHDEIVQAINPVIDEICEGIKEFVDNIHFEFRSDISKVGIYLCGSGSIIYGLDKAISQSAMLPVHVAENPSLCSARGAGIILVNEEYYKNLTI